MDLTVVMVISAGFLGIVFLALLIILLATDSRKGRDSRHIRRRVSSDLNRIKEQINGESEEEW